MLLPALSFFLLTVAMTTTTAITNTSSRIPTVVATPITIPEDDDDVDVRGGMLKSKSNMEGLLESVNVSVKKMHNFDFV